MTSSRPPHRPPSWRRRGAGKPFSNFPASRAGIPSFRPRAAISGYSCKVCRRRRHATVAITRSGTSTSSHLLKCAGPGPMVWAPRQPFPVRLRADLAAFHRHSGCVGGDRFRAGIVDSAWDVPLGPRCGGLPGPASSVAVATRHGSERPPPAHPPFWVSHHREAQQSGCRRRPLLLGPASARPAARFSTGASSQMISASFQLAFASATSTETRPASVSSTGPSYPSLAHLRGLRARGALRGHRLG